jgi:hypothetical protein
LSRCPKSKTVGMRNVIYGRDECNEGDEVDKEY